MAQVELLDAERSLVLVIDLHPIVSGLPRHGRGTRSGYIDPPTSQTLHPRHRRYNRDLPETEIHSWRR